MKHGKHTKKRNYRSEELRWWGGATFGPAESNLCGIGVEWMCTEVCIVCINESMTKSFGGT